MFFVHNGSYRQKDIRSSFHNNEFLLLFINVKIAFHVINSSFFKFFQPYEPEVSMDNGIAQIQAQSIRTGDKKQNYGANAVYRTQSHPVWDQTGRYFAFNSDASGKTHVYLADLNILMNR